MQPSQSLLARLMQASDDTVSDGFTYDEAKSLAQHPDPEVRCSLARRGDVVPEVLYFLASDPDPKVRQHLANNTATPRQADYMLADDLDEDVRSDLARKIARLSPGLTPAERDKIRHVTYLTLEKLARDQMPMVRFAISDTIKSMPDVPAGIVRKLAHDLDIIVAAPILEFSPILTDEDLLNIIEISPVAGAITAIARRCNLSENVSHGIAISQNADAMVTLLENGGAQIREETLNLLVENSRTEYRLQDPLVQRPNLPPNTARRLATFVAEHLLHVLAARQDLPQDTLDAVKHAIDERLEDFPPSSIPDPVKELLAVQAQMDRAKRLLNSGQLSSLMFTDAMASQNEHPFAKAILAVRTGLRPQMIIDILGSNSAKAVVSLIWYACFTMEHAVTAQNHLAHIKPDSILHPNDGGFPISKGEMQTQIAVFTSNPA